MDRFAPLFVIVAASLWGIDGIVLRPSLYSLPVPLVVFVESSAIALVLTLVLGHRLKALKELTRRDWLAFLAVAILGGVVGTMSITRALFYVNYVNLSVVVLIQKLQPVFAILLAALWLKEKPGPRFVLWASLAVAGAYIMTFGFDLPVVVPGDKTLYAVLFALLAAFGFGASTVFGKRALRQVSFEIGTYIRFAVTAILMSGVALATGDVFQYRQIQPGQLWIFTLIVFTTGGPALFLYYFGLKRIKASVATICELAFPLTAIVLEYVLRGNTLTLVQWLGAVALVGSIIQVSRRPSRKLTPEAAEFHGNSGN